MELAIQQSKRRKNLGFQKRIVAEEWIKLNWCKYERFWIISSSGIVNWRGCHKKAQKR
jgi:hypothetical protein